MTEDCGGNTVTTSTTPLSWWYLQANSLSPWNDSKHAWSNQINPNSSSSCEEDISVSSTSFTNASNHSSLTVESSRRLVVEPHAAPSANEFMRDQHASDNQLWSHVLSGVGSNGELHNSQEIGENFLDALSSKNMASAMFEPACDYLKKLDTSWDYSGNSTPFNSFEKHLNGFTEAMIENNERLTKLSNLVSTWSIAPPEPEVNSSHHLDNNPQTNHNNNSMSLNNASMDHHHYPQPFGDSSPCSIEGANSKDSSGMFPNFYDQEMKVKQEYHHASEALFGKSFNANNGYQNNGLNSISMGDDNNSGKFYHGFPNLPPCTRNSSDVISFNNRLGRSVVNGIHAQRPNMKYSNLSESKKQGLQTPPQIRANNSRGEGTTREVKKKRSEESSEAISKKPKQDTSTASSSKVQAPKVKIADKITALQQIVSPFGKTDTASVLFEAIGYIKFLQEQVQLLSNPYLKTSLHKDPRGSFDRKDKEDAKLDLRSRGLCLVPTSCTPLVYRENTGPDYWTPAYRGCLYR